MVTGTCVGPYLRRECASLLTGTRTSPQIDGLGRTSSLALRNKCIRRSSAPYRHELRAGLRESCFQLSCNSGVIPCAAADSTSFLAKATSAVRRSMCAGEGEDQCIPLREQIQQQTLQALIKKRQAGPAERRTSNSSSHGSVANASASTTARRGSAQSPNTRISRAGGGIPGLATSPRGGEGAVSPRNDTAARAVLPDGSDRSGKEAGEKSTSEQGTNSVPATPATALRLREQQSSQRASISAPGDASELRRRPDPLTVLAGRKGPQPQSRATRSFFWWLMPRHEAERSSLRTKLKLFLPGAARNHEDGTGGSALRESRQPRRSQEADI